MNLGALRHQGISYIIVFNKQGERLAQVRNYGNFANPFILKYLGSYWEPGYILNPV